MRKKIAILGVASVVFVVVLMVFAGTALAAYPAGQAPGLHSNVADSKHDVALDGQPLCSPCHIPHGAAAGAKALWAKTPVTVPGTTINSEIAPLCYSCHSVAGLPGHDTAFDGDKPMHPIQTYTARRTAELAKATPNLAAANLYGRDCDRCHDPHENTAERPNFLRYQRITTSASKPILILGPNVCATCHTGNISNWPDRSGVVHSSHTLDTDGEVQDVVGITPINPSMAVYNAATDTVGSRFFVPSAGLPAYTTGAFQAGFGDLAAYDATTHQLVLGPVATLTSQLKCESCHAPHGAATAATEGLNTMDAVDGSLCSNCHN